MSKGRLELYNELLPQLEEFEDYRLDVLKQANFFRNKLMMLGGGMAAGVLAFVFLLSMAGGSLAAFMPFVQILALFAIIGTVVTGGQWFMKRKALLDHFRATHKEKILQTMAETVNPDMIYKSEQYIHPEEFWNSGLYLRKIHRYMGEDWFSGIVDDTRFKFSEIYAAERKQKRDSKGRTTSYYETIFRGIFMKADFPEHFAGRTYVMTDKSEKYMGSWLGKKMQKMSNRGKLLHFDDPVFEKDFVVYTTNEEAANRILTHDLLITIKEIKEKFKTDVQLAFVGQSVYISIPFDNILEPDINQSIMEVDAVYQYYEEIKMCFDVIENLNANTQILRRPDAEPFNVDEILEKNKDQDKTINLDTDLTEEGKSLM